jgi:catechol 2,3-dioxygenase-like lactoylglutathione lyase family enzyme
MPDTPSPTRIIQVATVFVPVADQDRALQFYVGKLGFEQRADFTYGEGSRWVEVAPPRSAIALALVGPTEGEPSGGDVTRCALVTEDIEADHAALRAGGVDVDAVIGRQGTSRAGLVSGDCVIPDPVPPQLLFRDPDGNRFLIVEPG